MNKIREIHVRLVGIPVLGVLLAFLLCPTPPPNFIHIIKTIAFVFVFWQGLSMIMMYFRKKYEAIQQTARRLVYTIIFSSVYLMVSDTLLHLLFDHFIPEHTFMNEGFFWRFGKNFIISFMVIALYESYYFYWRWNQSSLETEKLRTQHIFSQLEALKSQVSPHFLFNSLNTLVALIAENQQLAIEFTQKLSEVYRYILQHKEKELVKLSTELEFIRSYVFLLKMRFSDNLQVDYRIEEKYFNNYVAPFTLQLLVENAIKHNVISKTHPLHIEIYTENGNSLVVKNKLQKRNAREDSTKTGLENIRKRYHYLTDKSIDIITTNASFLVAIPLISVIEE